MGRGVPQAADQLHRFTPLRSVYGAGGDAFHLKQGAVNCAAGRDIERDLGAGGQITVFVA